MVPTPRQLNRATLARQLLLDRAAVDVPEAVRRIGALQAQEPASPYLALWARVADLDPRHVDAAFTGGAVVKATLMRITLHAVHADDYAPFHAAMVASLRGARLGDRRYTADGLTVADADELLPELVDFAAQPRTGSEMEAMLGAAVGDHRARQAWWALRTFAPLHHVPGRGPWAFAAPSRFVAAPSGVRHAAADRAAADGAAAVDAAADAAAGDEGAARGGAACLTPVRWLAMRYLEAFGPATAADFAQFTMLRRPVALQAMHDLAGDVEPIAGSGSATLFDVVGGTVPDENVPGPPRLLPMWDSTLLAYADRSRILPDEHRSVVLRRNGDVLPTVLVDGTVAGVWRPLDGSIEVTAFRQLDARTWDALAAESAALLDFVADRDPAVYGRYGHWWGKGIAGNEVRRLPG